MCICVCSVRVCCGCSVRCVHAWTVLGVCTRRGCCVRAVVCSAGVVCVVYVCVLSGCAVGVACVVYVLLCPVWVLRALCTCTHSVCAHCGCCARCICPCTMAVVCSTGVVHVHTRSTCAARVLCALCALCMSVQCRCCVCCVRVHSAGVVCVVYMHALRRCVQCRLHACACVACVRAVGVAYVVYVHGLCMLRLLCVLSMCWCVQCRCCVCHICASTLCTRVLWVLRERCVCATRVLCALRALCMRVHSVCVGVVRVLYMSMRCGCCVFSAGVACLLWVLPMCTDCAGGVRAQRGCCTHSVCVRAGGVVHVVYVHGLRAGGVRGFCVCMHSVRVCSAGVARVARVHRLGTACTHRRCCVCCVHAWTARAAVVVCVAYVLVCTVWVLPVLCTCAYSVCVCSTGVAHAAGVHGPCTVRARCGCLPVRCVHAVVCSASVVCVVYMHARGGWARCGCCARCTRACAVCVCCGCWVRRTRVCSTAGVCSAGVRVHEPGLLRVLRRCARWVCVCAVRVLHALRARAACAWCACAYPRRVTHVTRAHPPCRAPPVPPPAGWVGG